MNSENLLLSDDPLSKWLSESGVRSVCLPQNQPESELILIDLIFRIDLIG